MRKLIAAFSFLFLSALMFGQTATVSGHVITGQNTASSSGISVLFELTNDGGQQCKVGGTGLVMPMTATFTQAQLAAGVSLLRNDQITCGTTLGGTRWRYTIKSGGTGTRQCSINVVGTTNLDSTVCLNATATPVTTTPTDSVYARIDGTNAGFTGDITHNGHNDTGIGTLGATTLSGNPNFSGNPTFGGTIAVTGASTFTGTGNFKNLEAILFADQYGNGTTTGIAGAITAAGVVNKTNIWVPSSYATTENVPGSLPQWMFSGPGSLAVQGGNNAANITFQDNRFGRYFTALDPIGDKALYNPNVQQWFRWNVNYIAGPSGQAFNNRDAISINLNALDGGFNFNNNGYSNKENYAGIDERLTAFTPGQHVGIQSFNSSFSTGDMLSFFGQQACYGGFTAGGDETCESFDFEAYHGNVEYTATIASGASTGATSLTMNTPSAGGGTQGSYRFLIDITKIASAGTISAVTFTNGTTPVAITGVGTSFGTSNVNTTLGTAVVAPGAATVTPAAMTNITTASLLCIADPFQFEHVTPSATTGTTFTATFRYAHPTTAVVMAGGACGNYIELQADRVTAATFGSTSNVNTGGNIGNAGQVVNTLHYIIPMIGSTSNTAATIWLTNPNTGYSAYRGRWTSGGTNTYAIYPGAQVTSVQGATASCVNNSTCGTGNIGNLFTLEQNNAAWANGDTVALPLYFVQNVILGQMIYQDLFPQAGTGSLGSLAIIANGITQSGDTFIGITNNSPASIYTAGGGVLSPPWAFSFVGSFENILRINKNPTVLIRSNDNTSQGTIYQQGNNPLTDNDQLAFSPTTDEFWVGGTGGGLKLALNAQSGALRQVEHAAPSGTAGSSVLYADSTAHVPRWNGNNAGFQNLPWVGYVTSAYTNATTTFSNVTLSPALPAMLASANYSINCNIVWQGSASTTGPKFQFTGPASPTAVAINLESQVTSTTTIGASATAFSSPVANTGTITATTNFPSTVTAGIVNGANSGTPVLQAAANGAGTLTIQPGSYCTMQ